MMVAALVLAKMLVADTAADYFPLHPGDKYTYAVYDGKAIIGTYMNTIGKPIKVQEDDTVDSYPITLTQEDAFVLTVYYRTTADSVLAVCGQFKEKVVKLHPLLEPFTIFKMGEKKVKWTYAGRTLDATDPALQTVDGTSQYVGQREVLGKKVDVYEVTMDGVVGDAKGAGVKSKQVSYYAKGIGMYESRETTTIGKRKDERVRKLIKYQPAGD